VISSPVDFTVEERSVKGDPKVIAVLSEVLKAELTAINQYFLHAEMCENWGYKKLAGYTKKESIEEMKHAEILMERILYLDGTPNMSDYFKIVIGRTVPEQFKNDLQLEYDAVKRLNEGVELCRQVGDNGSRDLLPNCMPSTRWASRTTLHSSCTTENAGVGTPTRHRFIPVK
jgi:bacterioferritin